MLPDVFVISISPVDAEIEPEIPTLLSLVIDALLAPTIIFPTMLPSELLDIEEELPEPAIFIAVPDEPADIVPVLLIVLGTL